jgi:hypothetical protein
MESVIRELKRLKIRTLTLERLKELGLPNVVSLPQPASLVNNGVCVAKTIRYESEDAVCQSRWFQEGLAGALIVMFSPSSENEVIEIESFESGEVVAVRLFSFTNWKEDFGDRDYAPLSPVHSGSALKPI